MNVKVAFFVLVGAAVSDFALANEPQEAETSLVLIRNVSIFDGLSDELSVGQDVLISDDLIAKIDENIPTPDGGKVIDGGGRVLTPGFIDAHVHLQWNVGPYEFIDSSPGYLAALALLEAENTLMRGFTTVRDTAGAVFGVRKAIDAGYFPGPRIYASGAAIGMTSGHGDARSVNTLPRGLGGPAETELERIGVTVIADGVPEVLTASRDQFRRGSNFIKMFVGGAVTGLRDPIDVSEYSFDEIKAAAGEAKRWNSYLAVHSYTDRSTREALDAGALSIEHANLLTESTMKLAKKKGAFISAQTGVFLAPLPQGFSAVQRERQKQAAAGLDTMMNLAKKHKVKLAFGTDFVGSMDVKKYQLTEFTNRTRWFSNAEILMQATSVNGELMALSGPRNPYRAELGVIKEGAFADLLLINGNPLQDISVLTKPRENLVLIMKGGKIYKNMLDLGD